MTSARGWSGMIPNRMTQVGVTPKTRDPITIRKAWSADERSAHLSLAIPPEQGAAIVVTAVLHMLGVKAK